MKKLFGAAARNTTLDHTLRQDKNVFFLHLLGLDTTGHAYRPYSREYLHNIKVVDRGVKDMTKLIEDFFGDGKTAFVFTADHGMSDWGSHGDGHPDNTRTPLIVWGSGVAKPIISKAGRAAGHEDNLSADWGLDQVQRNDVNQADVAALMAYLAGIDFPVNSVGQLPLAYIAGDPNEKAEAALANARGVLEMYRVKEEQKKSSELRFRAYAPLADEVHSLEHRLKEIREAIDQNRFQVATEMSQDLLKVGLDGLRYLQRYDWVFLRVLVTTGYLGWIAFAITTVIDMHVLHGKARTLRSPATTSIFGATGAMLFSLLLARNAPISYFAYAVFPLIFWEEVLARREALSLGCRKLLKGVSGRQEMLMLGAKAVAFVGVLELLVRSDDHTRQGYNLQRYLRFCPIFTELSILSALWLLHFGLSFTIENSSCKGRLW